MMSLSESVFLYVLFGMTITYVTAVGLFARIFQRAGYSPWLALGFFVPLINVILLPYFAFSDWPALRGRHRR